MGQWHALPFALDTVRNRLHVVKHSLEDRILVLTRNTRHAEQILGNRQHSLLGAVVEHSRLAGWRRRFGERGVFGHSHFDRELLEAAGGARCSS